MPDTRVRLHQSWLEVLGDEFDKPYMQNLRSFIAERLQAGAAIFPPPPLFFAALDRTPFDRVKVVILGQDPYIKPGEAHGLSFSVNRGITRPPSLRNIYRELNADVGVPEPQHGCLEGWADQGVLLLNSILSVEQGKSGSHAGKGWETFTDRVIREINDKAPPTAFILWGSYARKKAAFVDRSRHCVVESGHPSPTAVNTGGNFPGSRPFSKVNAFLEKTGRGAIDWSLD